MSWDKSHHLGENLDPRRLQLAFVASLVDFPPMIESYRLYGYISIPKWMVSYNGRMVYNGKSDKKMVGNPIFYAPFCCNID
jgi:hypothetical protein